MHDAEIRVHTVVDTKEFAKLDTAMVKTKSSLKALSARMKDFGTNVMGSMKNMLVSVKEFGSAFLGAFGKMALIGIAVKGIQVALKALKEGLENLAQASPQYNEAMSDFKSSLEQLKNALASAFEPIITAVLPYLTMFVNWIIKVIDYLGQFFAVLTGRNSYFKAKKQAIDYAKSLKGVEKETEAVNDATEEANKGLASFDKLNNLSSSSTSGGASTKGDNGTSSGGGALKGADAFEEVEIDPEKFAWLEKLKTKFGEFKDKCVEVWGIVVAKTKEAWENIKAFLAPVGEWIVAHVVTPVQNIWQKVKEVASNIWGAIKPVLVTIGEGASELWNKIKEICNTIKQIITVNVNAIWNGLIKPTINAIKTALTPIITFIKTKVITPLVTAFTAFKNKVTQIFKDIATKVADFVGGAIKKVINGLFEKIENFVNFFIENVNKLVDFTNKFNPGEDIKHIEPLTLPRLATGGIVTEPTRALIGEAGREAVLPLDRNTEWMDKLADRLASALQLEVYSDPNGMFKVMQRKSREYTNMTGRKAFT